MNSYIRLKDVRLSFRKYRTSDFSLRRSMIEEIASVLGRRNVQRENGLEPETLKGVSLDLEAGTKLGLVGCNGGGKSSLLRVMGGIYQPTSGVVEVQGRVTTLLNAGFCMDNNLTGYENIRLGCALLKIPKNQLKSKIDEIIDFSELENSLHKPVEHYSEGMRSRLGFSVVTSVQPEIMLIDEAIATGDKFFIEKATDKINKMMKASSLLVLATHDEHIMRRLCNKVALIQDGKVAAIGETEEVLGNYQVAA
jgi:ABC-type polysaccharide/polyol phosphate transport system ATPase subunit